MACLISTAVRAGEIWLDLRALADGASCSVSGAEFIGSGCYGYVGYGASLNDPSFSPIRTAPLSEQIIASGTRGTASAQIEVPDSGYLAKFRATSPGGSLNNLSGQIGAFLDVRFTETIKLTIPDSYAGQDVFITAFLDYDGDYFKYRGPTATGVDSGSLNLRLRVDGIDDFDQYGYAASETAVNDRLAVRRLVRSASSSATVVDVPIGVFVSAGSLTTVNVFDIDFQDTLYFDVELPNGVTADLGILANRAFDDQSPGNRIPEPGTLALFGLGLAGLAATRRRKQ